MKSLYRIILLLVIIGMLGVAYYAGTRSFRTWEKTEEVDADVLLTQVKAAFKLVTAEGYFSEIYDYKDYYRFDISPLRKKALMRVKAKVSLGYDLEQMHVEALPDDKVVIISNIPEISVISIDHEIDYYDITEGTFNSFSAQDYNALQERAKAFIRQHALDSQLTGQAEMQGEEAFDLIRTIVESAGWSLVLERRAVEESPFAG